MRVSTDGKCKFPALMSADPQTKVGRLPPRANTLVSFFAEALLQTICLKLPHVRDKRPGKTEMALSRMRISVIFLAAHVLQKFAAFRKTMQVKPIDSLSRCLNCHYASKTLEGPYRLTLANFAVKLY